MISWDDYREKKILPRRKLKENAVRVSIRALSVEKTFDFSQCDELKKYNVEEEEEEGIKKKKKKEGVKIGGKCDEETFQRSYQKFFQCKSESEAKLKSNVDSLEERIQEKVDEFLCAHFEHVSIFFCALFVPGVKTQGLRELVVVVAVLVMNFKQCISE